ncbi:hypothetical protein MHTCC0001_26510 [Flavobacteriaceae bacterium MHTCC 0001]
MIQPKTINYFSSSETDGVKLEYKYNLLEKRYLKKETKHGIRLAAIKITNNSQKDYVFGKDLNIAYSNGSLINVIESEKVFSKLKQGVPIYLLYLLLTPMNLYTSRTDSNGFQQETSSIPIGLAVGPGLAGGNMIAAGSANKNFKTELLEYNLLGKTIKKGETTYGIIGIDSNSSEALNLSLK